MRGVAATILICALVVAVSIRGQSAPFGQQDHIKITAGSPAVLAYISFTGNSNAKLVSGRGCKIVQHGAGKCQMLLQPPLTDDKYVIVLGTSDGKIAGVGSQSEDQLYIYCRDRQGQPTDGEVYVAIYR